MPAFVPLPVHPIPMASDQTFVDFITKHILLEAVQARKMFGEYGLYAGGKFFGLVCDNKLYIKPTAAGLAFIGEVVEAAPYEGAKPAFLIEEKIEDREWLTELIRRSLSELPEAKKKKK